MNRLVAGLIIIVAGTASAQDVGAIASTAAPGKYAADGPAPNAFAPIAAKVWPSIVKVYGAGGFTGIPAYGTGVVVDPSGIVATAWSISLKTEYLKVVTDQGQRLDAKILRADSKKGMALLKVELGDVKLTAAELADSTTLAAGDQVYGIGNAFDDATGDEKCAVMGGVVMAIAPIEMRIGIEDAPPLGNVILTDVANNPGTQGGPLVTRDGKIVGILGRLVESKSTNSLVNFAIPTATWKPFIAAAVAGKEPPAEPAAKKAAPVETGIRLLDAHLTRSPPAYVDRVLPGSPAEKAGVKADDLIFRLDGKVVRTCRVYEDILRDHAPGDKVKLVIKRGNGIVELEVELAARKEK
jgi:serine protease Do